MRLRTNRNNSHIYALLLIFWCLLPLLAVGQRSDVPLDAQDIDSSEAEAPVFLKKMLDELEAEKEGKKISGYRN